MSLFCKFSGNTQYDNAVNELTLTLGSKNSAIGVLEHNGGKPINQNLLGFESKAYKALREKFDKRTSDRKMSKLLTNPDYVKSELWDFIKGNNLETKQQEDGTLLLLKDGVKKVILDKDGDNYYVVGSDLSGLVDTQIDFTKSPDLLDLLITPKYNLTYKEQKNLANFLKTRSIILEGENVPVDRRFVTKAIARQFNGDIYLNKATYLDEEDGKKVFRHDNKLFKNWLNDFLKANGLENVFRIDERTGRIETQKTELFDSIKASDLVTSLENPEEFEHVSDILNFLKNRLGVDYHFITQKEARQQFGITRTDVNAFSKNQDVYFIKGRKFSADIASEEMLHPLVAGLAVSDPSLFQELLAEAQTRYTQLHTELVNTYPAEDVDQELVTQALAREFVLERTSNPKGHTLSSLLQKFKQWILDFFSGNPGLFKDDSRVTLQGIAQLINSELEIRYQKVNHLNFNQNKFSKQDLISLIYYYYKRYKPESTDEDLKQAIAAYNSGQTKFVKDILDLIWIRQAELHVRGKDIPSFRRGVSGYINWENSLGGIDITRSIEDQQPDPNRLATIENYTVDPAEIIVPKLYKTAFKLGNVDLNNIDLDYFKKVNSFYRSKLKCPLDFIVRTHTSNIGIQYSDSLEAPENMTAVMPVIKDGYRLDPEGNRMYKLPPDTNYQIYKDSYGNELIIFNNKGALWNFLHNVENLVSIQPLLQNCNKSEISELLQGSLNIDSPIDVFSNQYRNLINQDPDSIRKGLQEIYEKGDKRYKNVLSNVLYNSFIKTLQMISVRIPTQAFQSIMAVKVKSLTNDESNDVFVSRWQYWLQGSDLDIKR